MKMYFKIVSVFIYLASSVNTEQQTDSDAKDYNKSVQLIDRISMIMFKAVYEQSEDKNVVCAPLSFMILLALYGAATYNNKKEPAEVPAYYSAGVYQTSNPTKETKYNDPSYDSFDIFNKIFVSDKYTLEDKLLKLYYDVKNSSKPLAVDYFNPALAATVINEWVKENTKRQIEAAVSEDTLDPNTVAELFNFVYFKGLWDVPANASHSSTEDFYSDQHYVIKKPTMYSLPSFNYTESKVLGATLIEIPYKDPEFRMVVILPNEKNGIPSVLEKAAEFGLSKDILNLAPAEHGIKLDVPIFNMKKTLNFNNILPRVGVSKYFDEFFGGIVKNETVVISKAIQKISIEVDEEGTTVKAVTDVAAVAVTNISEPPPPLVSKVDHQFVFVIMAYDHIVFVGSHSY